MARTRRKVGGRKSKGPRVPCTIRFPEPMHERMVQAAAAGDYSSFQDFVLDLVDAAEEAGTWPSARQDRLPISA